MTPLLAERLTGYWKTDVIAEGETGSKATQARGVSVRTGEQDPFRLLTTDVFRGGTLAESLRPRRTASEEDGAGDEEDAVSGSAEDKAEDKIVGGLADWPRAVETRWIEEHQLELRAFAGEWVVVDREKLVAHDGRLLEVVNMAKSLGIKVPYVVRIPEELEAPFIG